MSDSASEIRHVLYVVKYYPGIMSAGSISTQVPKIDPYAITFDEGCFAFQFFEQKQCYAPDGELLKGSMKEKTGRFFRGEVFSLPEVRLRFPDAHVLVKNMEANNWSRVIRTTIGNFQPFEENDTLIEHAPFPAIVVPDASGRIKLPS